MARLIVVMVDGRPERAWHDEALAQGDVDRYRTPAGKLQGGVELWDVPVGRSVGPAEKVDGA